MPDGLAELVADTNTHHTHLQNLKAASDEAAANGIIQQAVEFFE